MKLNLSTKGETRHAQETIYTDAFCKKGKSDELFTQGSI